MLYLAIERCGRTRWIDALRGVAISALVTYHVVYGMVDAGMLSPAAYAGWGPIGDLVRMPLMMFVAGMFVGPSLRKGAAAYLGGKLRRILYPFLVWSALYIAIRVVTPGVNNPLGWGALLLIPLDPQSHLWFLRTLFVYYLLALALPLRWLGVVAVVAAALGGGHGHGVDSGLHLLVYFAAGMWARRALERRWLAVSWPTAAGLVALGLGLPLIAGSGIKYTPGAVPVAFVGITAVIVLTLVMSRAAPVARVLTYLGERSLQLYLAHVLAASGARILLGRWGVDEPSTVFPLVLIAAFAGPLALAELVARLRIPGVFEWPATAAPSYGRARPRQGT